MLRATVFWRGSRPRDTCQVHTEQRERDPFLKFEYQVRKGVLQRNPLNIMQLRSYGRAFSHAGWTSGAEKCLQRG